MKNFLLIALILVVLGAFAFVFATVSDERASESLRGSDAGVNEGLDMHARDFIPDVSLTDERGQSFQLASFVGTPLVINSWATWCPFCVEEIPDFVRLQQEFGDALVVVAVNRRESKERSERFLEDLGVDTASLVFLYDERDNFYRTIGGFSMPETLFVNAQGGIVFHKRGFMDFEEMKEHAEKIASKVE